MTVISWGLLTYLVSKNKCLCFWLQQLAYVSKAQIVRASKLVESIDLDPTKKCNPIEVFVDSENPDNCRNDLQIGSAPKKQAILGEVIDLGSAH